MRKHPKYTYFSVLFVKPKYDRNVIFMYIHTYTKKLKAVIKANQRNYTNHNHLHQETDKISPNSICLLYQPDGNLLLNYASLFKRSHQDVVTIFSMLCIEVKKKKTKNHAHKKQKTP